ncbi:MAG: tetratricopeptide repeat protein [Armatimonadota bacterium]|nr:tetratricopeptide repeat protein [Armatimonadota bacterium]
MAKPSSAPPSLRQPEWLRQFGRRLRAARVGAGLSQQDLAAPDLSKGFVSLLETARSYPSVETVLELAQRTGTSVASLLLDPTDLRVETAFNLLHLAWTMDPAQHSGQAQDLVTTAERLVPDMPAAWRVRALLVRARAAMAVGDMAHAVTLAGDAVDLASRSGLDSDLARALTVKGIVDGRRGAFSAGTMALQQAIETMRRKRSLGSEEGIWASLSLGAIMWQVNETDSAEAAYRQALELATAEQMPRMQGRALTGLGLVAQSRQQLDVAVDFFSKAYDVFEQIEDLPEMGRVLNNLGLVRRLQGLYDEALSVLNAALRIRDREGNRRGRSATLDEIAQVYLALKRWDKAADAAGRAITDAQAAGDQAKEALAQVTLARALRAKGQARRAAEVLRTAVAALARLGMPRDAAVASKELGLILKDTGHHAEAAEYLAQALTLSADEPTFGLPV